MIGERQSWQARVAFFWRIGASIVSKIQVFVSFDTEHDGKLYERLLSHSKSPTSSFGVLGRSERVITPDVWSEKTRRKIADADQVIIICGEHTESATHVSAELRIAGEEGTPYFLLWGRRELMCTKPVGAKTAEGMYSWTRQVLHDQIALISRKADADATAETLRNATRKGCGPSDKKSLAKTGRSQGL